MTDAHDSPLPSHDAVRPRRARRFAVAGASLIVLVLLILTLSWPRWGWRVAALGESPLTGPWRLPDQPITVLTWNIRFGERLDEALELIRDIKPDVLCLQEIKPAQVGRIERELDMDGHWSPSSNLIGDAAWGNAVFVAGTLDEVQSLRDANGGAFGIWASAEVKGGRFVVASVHLMHAKRKDGGFGVRVREAQALVGAYATLMAPNGLEVPAVIAGDFNEPPVGAVYRLLTTKFVDAAPDAGATLPAAIPLARVDFVFASPNFEPAASSTIASTISDHRPVQATLGAKSLDEITEASSRPAAGQFP